MTALVVAPKFEEHFWGAENKGFDVLLQNYKVGLGASKELNEFIKERLIVEDSYVKGLTKLSKNMTALPNASAGSLSPMWQVLHSMCTQLSAAHSQFIQLLQDLSREVSDYSIAQKEKMKANMKGEIEGTQDSLRLLETQDTSLQRAKKLYTQSVEQLIKLQNKVEKTKGEANPKTRQQMDSRLKQAQDWMGTMKDDYKQAVETHTQQLTAFQGNMQEACLKFESIEEEHLAQMILFITKLNKAQESTHVLVGEAHQELRKQIHENSVEKLLCTFVEAKGTGRDKPVPEKFRTVNLSALSALAPSHEDQRTRSPSTDSQKSNKPDRSLTKRIRFKKKGKTAKPGGDSTSEHTGEHIITGPQEAIPAGEVDEEGYSIRPQDAAEIRGFPDDNPTQDSDDSDFEDDFQSRVRQVQIRDPPQDLPKATVDDIRASVQTLKLGGQHSPNTRIRKATSSQSLNNILSTPPSERKNTSLTSAFDPATSSLLDSDISLSPSVGMAAPLQPLSVASLSSDPTEPLPVMMWSQQPAPLLPSPFTPPTSIALPSLTGDSTSGSPDNTKKPVPKPRRTSTGTHQGPADSPLEETAPKKNSPSELAKDGDVRIQVPMSGWSTGYSSDEELPVAQPTFPIFDSPRSDSSGSLSDPDTQTVGMLSPPRHNPRKNTRQRGTTPEQQALSPLVTSQISASPPATGATSPVLPVTPNTSLPTVQDTSPAVQGVPLAVAFQEVCNAMFKSHDPSDCMVKITGEMVVSFPASLLGKLETYSRICFKLKGTDKLKQVLHNQILLTRNWDDEGFSYSFNTPALSAHLASMASKRTAPFYNMQLIKYEVDVTDGKLLPVRLAAFWKCTETITNFRFDYTYIGGNLPTSKRPTINQLTICVPVNGGVRNTLSKPSGNWLSDTQQLIWTISDIEASDNETPTSIHAKFDVSQGPSTPQPVTVKFGCDGSTVSGIGLELMGTDFRVSLLKNKFSSGKYSAEMRYTP